MYLTPSNSNKRDPEVEKVQRMLNLIRMRFHHNWEHLAEDGIYGKHSANAVRQFQIYKGISSLMTADGPVLGDTTIGYIRQEYDSFPKISAAPPLQIDQISKKRSEDVNKPKVMFDLVTLLSNKGAPIYKALEEAFPIAFKRLSAQSDKPLFVFSKQMAYHNGARYARISIPENVIRYLGRIGLAWSWCTIVEEIKQYNQKRKSGNASNWDIANLGAKIYTLCTSSLDVVLSSPATKQFAARIAGRYAVAETGAAFSLTGATALSTIGACIGAFLLGWEIGLLIGDIPIGDGRRVQDVIDDQIAQIWDHPYKMLGITPIAAAIDSWKKIVEWNVNRVSNLKPLSPAEKQKLDQYLKSHREMVMYSAPPNYVFTSKI